MFTTSSRSGSSKSAYGSLLILLFGTERAVQHNTAGITLSNFIGNAGGNDGVFTFAIVIRTNKRAIARRPLINCACVSLSTKIFLIRLPSVKLKPISPLAMVIRFISMGAASTWALYSFANAACFCCSLSCLSRSKRWCLFILCYRRPSFTRLNARFFRRSLDLRRFFAGD